MQVHRSRGVAGAVGRGTRPRHEHSRVVKVLPWGRQPICILDTTQFAKGEWPSAGVDFAWGHLIRLTIKGANGRINQGAKIGDYNFGEIDCWTDAAGVQKGTCEGFSPPGVTTYLHSVPDEHSRLIGFSSSVSSCQGESCAFVPTGPTDITASYEPAVKLTIHYYTQIVTKIEVSGGPTKTCYNVGNTPWGPQIACEYMVKPGQFVVINISKRDGNGPWQPIPQSFWQGTPCEGQPPGACSLFMVKPQDILIP
jgi:hypothetical protein